MKITVRVLVLFAAFGMGMQSFNLPAPWTPVPGINPTAVVGAQAS